MSNNIEFVTVNENENLWLINYHDGIAHIPKLTTIEALEHNNIPYNQLGQKYETIYEYLENQNYNIDEENSDYDNDIIRFTKRTFIYLPKE